MPTETFTPAQAAAKVKLPPKNEPVHPNTVRAWTTEYAEVLSKSAKGRPRLLTPRDVALLQLVAQWRAAGLPPDAVLARLRTVPDADIAQPYIDASVAPTLPVVASSEESTTPAVSTVDVSSLLREFTAIVDTRTAQHADSVRQLDERLRMVESRRTLAVAVIVALCVGLIIGLLLALLLLSRAA